MLFTKNIVLETLNQYRGSQYLGNSERTYRWVALIPEDLRDMEQDILYVCNLSEAMKRNLESPGYHYLCIRDRFTDDDEDAKVLNGTIVINENKNVSWLLNVIQQRFLQINKWVMDMREALVDNCDYQLLLDLGEPILRNFVAILDSSYKLLAYTKSIPTHSPINVALIEKGYHGDDTIQKFKAAKRFELYEHEHGVIISPPGGDSGWEIGNFEFVNKICHYGGEWLLHVTMECSQIPLSPALVDLFEVFMDNVDVCFSRQQRAQPSHVYSSLFNEILYGDLVSPYIIADRAKAANVPFHGNFNAYRIVFKDNSTVLLGRFVQELQTFLSKSKIIAHNYEVSALNIYDSPKIIQQSKKNLDKLIPLFEKYDAVCGVSEFFTSLSEFKNACMQATRAHSLGIRLGAIGNYWQFDNNDQKVTACQEDSSIYFYNDVYIFMMLYYAQSGEFDTFKNTAYNEALRKLMDYDSDNGTRLVQVLYTHLNSERRATTSGRLLHMHRNNVLYHISRIEEILGIDLDDYWTRLKLMLAFHFFELQEANRLFTLPSVMDS